MDNVFQVQVVGLGDFMLICLHLCGLSLNRGNVLSVLIRCFLHAWSSLQAVDLGPVRTSHNIATMLCIHADLPSWGSMKVRLATDHLIILPEMIGKLLLDLQLMQLVISLLLLQQHLHSLPLLFFKHEGFLGLECSLIDLVEGR